MRIHRINRQGKQTLPRLHPITSSLNRSPPCITDHFQRFAATARLPQVSGSSATTTEMPVSSHYKRSRLRSSATTGEHHAAPRRYRKPAPAGTVPVQPLPRSNTGQRFPAASRISCWSSGVKPRGTPSQGYGHELRFHVLHRPVSRTDFVLDTFCGGFTDQRTVITTYIAD